MDRRLRLNEVKNFSMFSTQHLCDWLKRLYSLVQAGGNQYLPVLQIEFLEQEIQFRKDLHEVEIKMKKLSLEDRQDQYSQHPITFMEAHVVRVKVVTNTSVQEPNTYNSME